MLAVLSNSTRVIGPIKPIRTDRVEVGRDDVVMVPMFSLRATGLRDLRSRCSQQSDFESSSSDVLMDIRLPDNYKTTKDYDWVIFRRILESFHSKDKLCSPQTRSMGRVAELLEHDIPRELLDSEKRSQHTAKTYRLPEFIKNFFTKRNRLRNIFQRTRHPTDKWYNQLDNEIKPFSRDHRQHTWDDLVEHPQEHSMGISPRVGHVGVRRAPLSLECTMLTFDAFDAPPNASLDRAAGVDKPWRVGPRCE